MIPFFAGSKRVTISSLRTGIWRISGVRDPMFKDPSQRNIPISCRRRREGCIFRFVKGFWRTPQPLDSPSKGICLSVASVSSIRQRRLTLKQSLHFLSCFICIVSNSYRMLIGIIRSTGNRCQEKTNGFGLITCLNFCGR
jgi:hypothetical protein